MNISAEDLIEELIFSPQTVAQLAWLFAVPEETVAALVMELREQGRIAPVINAAWGDARCTNVGEAEFEGYCELPRDPCLHCGGFLEDACKWTYVGGPISEALAAVA